MLLEKKTYRTPLRMAAQALNLGQIAVLYKVPGFTVRVSRCPVCGASPDKLEYSARYTPLDHCGGCGHVYSRIVPKERILGLMYKDLDYWMRDKNHQGINTIEPGVQWQPYLKDRMAILTRTVLPDGKARKIFELGCSEGMLLKELQDRGHDVLGCEVNKPTAELGMKTLGVKIRTGLFENIELAPTCYDVVASFHTVEHLCDLKAVFGKISAILKPDGATVIEVPTGPEEYRNSDHLQFFDAHSLRILIEQFFEECEIIPNQYTNPNGVLIGSLYAVGRRPRGR